MKKILALALALTLAVSSLAACGAASSSSTAPAASTAPSEAEKTNEPVTIQVSFWDATTTERMDRLIEGFKKVAPWITIDLVDIPSADYTTKLSVMLNGGSDVDAFFIKDADTTPALAAKGQLEDLSEYIKRDNIDLSIYNGVAENFQMDGKTVALPASSSYYILYYNKDIFDKNNIEYPTNDMTWTEFEELAGTVTSGTGENKDYGALFHTWQACAENWAVVDGKTTILSDDLSAFKTYYDMAICMQDAGTCMDYATLKTGNLHYSSMFMQGHVAMMPMGGWFCSTMLNKKAAGETDVNWGIATLPHPEGVEAGYTVGGVTPIAVNAKSEKKDAAWEFAKFVASEEGAKLQASVGEFPAYLNADTLESIANLEGMPEGALDALQVKNIVLDRPLDEKSAEVNQMLGEQHSLIMLKEVTVDEGVAEMEKLSKEIRGVA